MSGAFYSALLSRDVSAASELGQSAGNWPELAMEAIAKLDESWQDDTLSIGIIAEAYWTLRRALDQLVDEPVNTSPQLLNFAKAVVHIPTTEQHTFGPQMLVDQIRRIGWEVRLENGLEPDALIDLVSSEKLDVLGVSIGTDSGLAGLADLLAEVREHSVNSAIAILVGGNAIDGPPKRYEFLGADWVATTTDDALVFFERGWSELKRSQGSFDG